MIFTAYSIESDINGPDAERGRWPDSLARPYQWEHFEKRLAKLQRRHGFSIFHSTEFKARKGEFAGWTDVQSVALIDDLVALVRDKLTMGLACTLPYDRFKPGVSSTTDPKEDEAR